MAAAISSSDPANQATAASVEPVLKSTGAFRRTSSRWGAATARKPPR